MATRQRRDEGLLRIDGVDGRTGRGDYMGRRRTGDFNATIEAEDVLAAVAVVDEFLAVAGPDHFCGVEGHGWVQSFAGDQSLVMRKYGPFCRQLSKKPGQDAGLRRRGARSQAVLRHIRVDMRLLSLALPGNMTR